MNREALFTGLFLIGLGVFLFWGFPGHGRYFGAVVMGFGVLITFNSFAK